MQNPGYLTLVLNNGVPHFLQKCFLAPSVTWYSATLSSPEMKRALYGMTAYVENAEPFILLHMLQWQFTKRRISAAASNLTAPQLHAPERLGIFVKRPPVTNLS